MYRIHMNNYTVQIKNYNDANEKLYDANETLYNAYRQFYNINENYTIHIWYFYNTILMLYNINGKRSNIATFGMSYTFHSTDVLP